MAPTTERRTPAKVSRAMVRMGEVLSTWRKLRRLTVAEVADRANISVSTLSRLERGNGASLENTLAVRVRRKDPS